jgi:hypothetical protein
MVAAVAALGTRGPGDLLKYVNIDREGVEVVTPDDLQALLDTHNQQDNHGVRQLALALAEWDFAEEPAWDSEDRTEPRTMERRALVHRMLRLSSPAASRLDEIAPVATMRTAVISTRWEPWYDEKRRAHSAFYWPHYRDHLLDQSQWSAESVAALDKATNEVIERISDPSSGDTYQSKGLVVGYVQSGKTANFTGVIAKAIDAGYRLIIVMTGTIELLRSQTQRRLDRELVGVENLIRGLDEGEAAEEFDYADDDDWVAGNFISHGDNFIARGYPGIERMTLLHDDYKRLKQGLSRMQFHLRDRSKPFWDPENLMPADARLVVVKKNSSILKKLAKDLKPLKHKLAEIPALIIDDESDLASINTKDPRKSSDRTAINRAITDLLDHLKRGQLVMYTATPFANFFVDPDDGSDIFPKNFILALDRPPSYMGVEDFHDVDWNSEDDKTDPATSNEKAYIRPVGPPPSPHDYVQRATRRAEMQVALDSFVLAGAIKIYRENMGEACYRHHTMLVHEARDTDVHSDQAELVREVWREAKYGTPEALARLRRLWRTDYQPVCNARADGFAVPDDFEKLKEPLGEAYRRIKEVGDPILIVNSDPDIQRNQQALDFDRNSVWRILIGGAKLSRGFTVEGLTVSFYTRKALQGDTLMQAGRWFGFRDGYQDLVRLFIRRDPDDETRRVDLYEAFEGLMRDEMLMRERLHDYEGFNDDGTPVLEPWQVPPIVSQHLPYLKPTGRTKMFNARITSSGDAGSLKDYYGLPPRKDSHAKEANYELVLPLLKAARERKTFIASKRKPEESITTFDALVGVVPATTFLQTINGMNWHPDYWEKVFEPTLRFYEKLIAGGRLEQVVVIWPQLTKSIEVRDLPGLDRAQIISRNRRASPRIDFVGSDAKHRDAPERVAGARKATEDAEADAMRDPAGRRAAVLLYLAADIGAYGEGKCRAADLPAKPDTGDLATLLSIVAPATATPHGRPVIEWTVLRNDQKGSPVIPQS